MLRKITLVLLLAPACFGQIIVGGRTVNGGQTIWTVPTPIIPPPPNGIPASLFAASWQAAPAKWPPFGGSGAATCTGGTPTGCATVTGDRLWDSSVKVSQIATCSGSPIVCTAGGTAWTKLQTLVNTTIPRYPMDIMYTFGSTPAGAAQGSAGTACATPDPATTCVPIQQIDANQSACNADGAASAATVHNDCGNGGNKLWQSLVYQIVNQFKGKIKYYECWNEQDSGNFWTNSSAFGGHSPQAANQPQMVRAVRMCSDIKHIVNALDPNALVVSPSFHVGTALTWFDFFSRTTVNDPGCSGSCSAAIGGITWAASTVTGKNTYDIVNVHARGSSTTNPDPMSFFAAYNNTVTEMTALGITDKPLFDDEWGPNNHGGSDNQSPTEDWLAHYMGAALSVRASTFNNPIPIAREWYYQYDQHQSPGAVEGLQGNVAGTAWDVAAGWWVGSSPTGICHANATFPTISQCDLTQGGGTPAQVIWNENSLAINTITAASNAGGGQTTYTCSGGCSGINLEWVTIAGFSNAANNGAFLVNASSSTSFTVNNAAGVAETNSAPTAIYLPVTCGTSCPLFSVSSTFHHWTDLTGTMHSIVAGQVPLGAKALLLTQ